jgi:hypothetical protein
MAEQRRIDEPPDAPKEEDGATIARRKLLRLTAYMAPAVLGTMLYSREAGAQPMSGCNPSQCSPNGGSCGPNNNCNPNGGPCGPSHCGPRN